MLQAKLLFLVGFSSHIVNDAQGSDPYNSLSHLVAMKSDHVIFKKEYLKSSEMFRAARLGGKPSDVQDMNTGKREIYLEDKNILRKRYKLKNST